METNCILPSCTREYCQWWAWIKNLCFQRVFGFNKQSSGGKRGRLNARCRKREREVGAIDPRWPIKHIRHISAWGIQMNNAWLFVCESLISCVMSACFICNSARVRRTEKVRINVWSNNWRNHPVLLGGAKEVTDMAFLLVTDRFLNHTIHPDFSKIIK